LACRVPERELDGFAVDAAVGNVIFKDGGHISLVNGSARRHMTLKYGSILLGSSPK
jgi:hypothetical protein